MVVAESTQLETIALEKCQFRLERYSADWKVAEENCHAHRPLQSGVYFDGFTCDGKRWTLDFAKLNFLAG